MNYDEVKEEAPVEEEMLIADESVEDSKLEKEEEADE